MQIKFLAWQGFVLNVRTRFPFRHGIATLTCCPHLFVRAEVAIDGQRSVGYAADHLPPKWFTKDPATSYQQDLVEMIGVIRHAGQAATELSASESLFQWWQQLSQGQNTWASEWKIPLLLAGFGTSFMERAAIDAWCRLARKPFAEALRANAFGLQGEVLEALPALPPREIICRHTVGLSDPITDADIVESERLNDGLPQSLQQCIAAYGLTHFKIKLSGDVAKDSLRLQRLAELIGTLDHFAFTLDGNENFKTVEPLRRLWDSLSGDAKLQPFLKRLLFVEQPLHRDVALDDAVRQELRQWRDRPPMIIDESDATLQSVPRALECGYQGVSHKNCKGVFKGLLNASRIAAARKQHPSAKFLLSGEDLSNIGPISLQQDLAVMATLGIDDVERNGQHYFKGLAYLPMETQQEILQLHPDLFHLHPRGFGTMRIEHGKMKIGSCIDAPFGTSLEPDFSGFSRLDDWSFDSL